MASLRYSPRLAQMAMLDISHPEVEDFIHSKSKLNEKNNRIANEALRNWPYREPVEKALVDNQLTHMNISVVITDAFMEAVVNDSDWDLISPSTGEVVKTVKAKELYRTFCEQAWKSGDPGVFFIDRTNKDNMVDYMSTIRATNPCGEIGLLDNEACCLGSINLLNLLEVTDADVFFLWEELEQVVRDSIRFLDNVQSLSYTTVEEINTTCKEYRRLGLGVMGFADLLAMMEIPYDSEQAVQFAEKLAWFIGMMAWSESAKLAEEREEFPALNLDLANQDVIEKFFTSDFNSNHVLEAWENIPVRNVSVTAIAPTGTIALLAGVNSGIEPFYMLAYQRNVTHGIGNEAIETMIEVNPILFYKLKGYLNDDEIEQVKKFVLETGSVQGCDLVPEHLQKVFKTAHEINWQDHIRIQAAWQKYITNAVSKTINLPSDATIEDIEQAYMYMWESGLKGGTVYRDKSKGFQVLQRV